MNLDLFVEACRRDLLQPLKNSKLLNNEDQSPPLSVSLTVQ